jgi:hypothetical protein
LYFFLLLYHLVTVDLILGKFPKVIMDFIYIIREGKEFGSYITVQTPNFSLPVKIYCYFWINFTKFHTIEKWNWGQEKIPMNLGLYRTILLTGDLNSTEWPSLGQPTKPPYRAAMVQLIPRQGHTKTVGAYPFSESKVRTSPRKKAGAQPGSLEIPGGVGTTPLIPCRPALLV